MMRFATAAAVLLATAAHGEELLRNGGFDEYEALMPTAWSVYLHPHNTGTLADAQADAQIYRSGTAAARIDNPLGYDEEPMNNWSQHVEGSVSGKRLMLRGMIKTAGDAEGRILLQCGIKRPYQTLKADSTDRYTPVRGDRDWTPVQMTIDVPPGTEFVTVRCVMEGVGTVWFDDLSLMDERDVPTEAEADPEPEAPLATMDSEDAETEPQSEPQVTEIAVTQPKPRTSTPARRSPEIVSAPPPLGRTPRDEPVDTVDPSFEELLRINGALQETVDALRETNSMLMYELRNNRSEIAELRSELEALRNDIGALDTEALPPNRRSAIPPIIPGNDPTKVF